MGDRFLARSASDRTDEWPFWFVADQDRGGLNVTAKAFESVTGRSASGACLAPRSVAEELARRLNAPTINEEVR